MSRFPRIEKLSVPQTPTIPNLPTFERFPIMTFPDIYVPKPRTVADSPIFDYNNPNQINSFADVARRQLRKVVRSESFGALISNTAEMVPELIEDTLTLMGEGTIKPLLQGNVKAVGINALINFGETMDIFANPVKGAILEKDDRWGGFVKGALGEKNYDYDTGNFLGDVGLEVISDPLNWVTLGGKMALNSLSKSAMTGLIKEAGVEVGDKAAKRLAKEIGRNLTDDFAKAVTDTLGPKIAKGIFDPDALDVIAVKLLREQTLDTTTTTIIKSLNKTISIADKLDGALFKTSIYTSAAFSPIAFKYISNSGIAKFAVNQINRIGRKYSPTSEINLKSWMYSYPEVKIKVETLKELDPHLDLEAYVLTVGESAVIKDYSAVADVIANSYKGSDDVVVFLDAVEKVVKERGYDSLDDFVTTVAKYNELSEVGTNISRLHRIAQELDRLKGNVDAIRVARTKQAGIDVIKNFVKETIDTLTGTRVHVGASVTNYTEAKNWISAVIDGMYKRDVPDEYIVEVLDMIDDLNDIIRETYSKGGRGDDYLKQIAHKVEYATRKASGEQLDPLYDLWQGDRNYNLVAKHIRETIEYLTADTNTSDVLRNGLGDLQDRLRNLHKVDDNLREQALFEILEDFELTLELPSSMKLDLLGEFEEKMLPIEEVLNRMNTGKLTAKLNELARQNVIKHVPSSFSIDLSKDLDLLHQVKAELFGGSYMVTLPDGSTTTIVGANLFNRLISDLRVHREYYENLDTYLSEYVDRLYGMVDSLIKDTKSISSDEFYDEVHHILDTIDYVRTQIIGNADGLARTRVIASGVELLDEVTDSLTRMVDMFVSVDESAIPAVARMQSFKHSQMSARFQLYDNEDLLEIVSDVRNMGATYAGLNTMMQALLEMDNVDGAVDVATILSKLNGIDTAFDLYGRILGSNLDEEVQIGLIDALERFANKELHAVADGATIDYTMTQIKQNIINHINASSVKERASLEAFIITEDQYIKDYASVNGYKYDGTAHDSATDVIANMAMAENMDLGLKVGDTPVFFDIETVGLGYNDDMLQISYAVPGQPLKTLNIKPREGQYPLPSVMVKLLSTPSLSEEVLEAYPIAKLQELFDAKFADGVDEATALNEFLDDMKLLKDDGRVRMVGHNIEGFDINHIRKRLMANRIDRFFAAAEPIDTLALRQKELGYRMLSTEESTYVDNLLLNYIEARNSELFNVFLARGFTNGVIPEELNRVSRKFIESPDALLSSSLRDLGYVVRTMSKNNANIVTQTYQLIADRMQTLRDSIGSSLSSIRSFNSVYSRYYIDADNLAELMPGLRNMSKDTHLLNITAFLNNHNVVDGKLAGFQEITAKTIYDLNLARQFYDDIPNNLPLEHRVKISNTAKRLQYFRNNVQKADVFDTFVVPDLLNVYQELKDEYLAFIPSLRMDPSIAYMKPVVNDPRTLFAQTAELYRRVSSMSIYKTKYSRLLGTKDNLNIYNYLDVPSLLRITEKYEYGNTKFFVPTHINKHAEDAYEFTHDLNKVRTHIDAEKNTFHALEALNQAHNVATPKLHAARAVLQPAQDAFLILDALRKSNLKGVDMLVNAVQTYDTQTANMMLNRVINFSQDEWESYLLNHAYGVTTFKIRDLDLVTGHTDEVKGILKKLTSMDSDSIGIHITDQRVYVYYKNTKIPDFENLKRLTFKDDLRLDTEAPVDFNAEQFKMFEDQLNGVRQTIISQSPNAVGTHLEHISRKSVESIREVLPKEVEDLLIPVQFFADANMFEGANFNHSVLGAFSSRKELMPFISANPLKNYYHVAQELAYKHNSVMNYTAMLMDKTSSLSGDLFKDYTDEQLFELLKEHKEYRAAFLVEDKKIGYKLKHVIIKSPKDVAFARKVDAVVLPTQFYNKSMAVINDYRFTNTFIKLFDKYIVGPTKLGHLTSLGLLMRNAFDSSTKNIVTSGTFDMVPHMFETMKIYNKYRGITKAILDEHQHLTKETIAKWLADNPDAMDAKLFHLIDEFINDGASAGMTAHVQAYMDDVYLGLHRRITDPELAGKIDADMIHRFINNTAAQDPALYAPEVYNELVRLQKEHYYYRNALSMREHTRNKRLTLDDLITYQKRPSFIPDDLRDEWKSLQKYRREHKVDEALSNAIYNNPISSSLLSVNGYLEQVSRLSLFTYELQRGASKAGAISDVIKTHFDYSNKTLSQKYLELMFPFITFSLKNLVYWAEMLDNKGWMVGLLRDAMMPMFDLQDYTPWDLQNRWSIQYQILAGNLILDEDTGFNLKLNPSVMDAFRMLYDPVGGVLDKTVPVVKGPIELLTLDENTFNYEERTRNIKVGMVPLFGSAINRMFSGIKYFNDTGNILNLTTPSVFGRTNLPEGGFKRFNYIWGQRPNFYRKTYAKKYYSRKSYPVYSKTAYPESIGAYKAVKAGAITYVPGYAAFQRRLSRGNPRHDMFTKTGKHRLNLMMIPTDGQDAQYKLANIWRRW